jgi:hypothetical protein
MPSPLAVGLIVARGRAPDPGQRRVVVPGPMPFVYRPAECGPGMRRDVADE